MKRDTVERPPWRDSLGIAIILLSAVLLALVLWQLARLGEQEGLDASVAARERLGIEETAPLVGTMDALGAYRDALVLNRPDLSARRRTVERWIAKLDADFKGGAASSLGIDAQYNKFRRLWPAAAKLVPGPKAYDESTPIMRALNNVFSAVQDGSNLSFDTSVSAQSLALDYVSETTYAMYIADRVRVLTELAVQRHGLALQDRLNLSSSTNGLRTGVDLSGDNLPGVAKRMTALIPERASEWNRLQTHADELQKAGETFASYVQKNVLLADAPNVPLALIDSFDRNVRLAAERMHAAAGAALEANLTRRTEVQAMRNRYFYLLFVVGAMLLAGIMIAIAQAVARRDRQALRDAQRESARLHAELARQQAEEALRLSEAQFRAVFDGAAIGIAIVERDGRLLDANQVFRAMFGDSIDTAMHGHEEDFNAVLAGVKETFEFEQAIKTPTGEIWADATVSAVSQHDDESPGVAICMFRDKTALKHSERRMQYDKTHDALTGLPNRQFFEQALRHRFDEASALLDSFFAVVFIDLQHFRDVNESMGHAAGDLVLTQIAGRLRSSVDARDVVARLGSDEFAVLVQSLGDILHVESIARRILNNLSKVVTISSKSVYLGASVGIAIGSSSYERAEDVMRDAETAMQHAKSTGGTRHALFDSKMHARAQRRLQLTSDLRLAIERSEFRVLYQPIVNIGDASPSGCEALVRWDHPTEGVVNPHDFVPLAEQTGLIGQIGRFVLETAASQLAAWKRNRSGNLRFTMNVNVSATELNDPDFERSLVQIIEHHGLAPSDLTIEIIESVVLDAGTRANLTLERIRDRGFRICIDDFGTGYSSMRYLQQFKVDAIKIDRSFVSGTDGDLASEPIVRTLMTLAEAFDVRVVAEGVETPRQREILRNAGCRYAQGYLYARPLTAAEMVSMYPEVLGRAPRSASA